MSAPGFRLALIAPGAPRRWVAIREGGKGARLTTFPEQAFTASRESVDAFARKKDVMKLKPADGRFEAEAAG